MNAASASLNAPTGNPYQPDLTFRGFTASSLLGTPQGLSVFQDGVRINEAFADVVNWDLLPRNAVASMQLLPGSNPVFGLNTLGGALTMAMKDGFAFPGGGASVSGSHRTEDDFREVQGIKLMAKSVSGIEMKDLKSLAERMLK